jgi:hypothetical protein
MKIPHSSDIWLSKIVTSPVTRRKTFLSLAAICPIASGDDRDRTGDLRLAKPPLSQLSYIPEKSKIVVGVLALSSDPRALTSRLPLFLQDTSTSTLHRGAQYIRKFARVNRFFQVYPKSFSNQLPPNSIGNPTQNPILSHQKSARILAATC